MTTNLSWLPSRDEKGCSLLAVLVFCEVDGQVERVESKESGIECSWICAEEVSFLLERTERKTAY